jgi:peroxiredoxin
MNRSQKSQHTFPLLVSASALTLVFFATSLQVLGGQFNPTRSIGDQVTGWTKLPGTDGKDHSLEDLKSFDFVVVVFTCNSCPYAVDYEDRINGLAKRFVDLKQNAVVVAINSNKIETDLMPAMKKRAQDKSFRFDYLFDASQEVAKQFGAVRTPEFFVLNKDRKIVYMGALDDNTKPDLVTKRYIETAIDAAVAGKPIEVAETPPVGCLIRFERRRK